MLGFKCSSISREAETDTQLRVLYKNDLELPDHPRAVVEVSGFGCRCFV